jgi:hypothetical protein
MGRPTGAGREVAFGAAALLSLTAAAPGAAAPVGRTAEEAVAAQREGMRKVVAPPCRHREADEIVVCGRSGPDPDRLPLRGERVAGDRVHLLPGEAPTGAAALAASNEGCRERCGFNIDFIRVGIFLFKVGKHLADPDSDPPPPPIPSDPYSTGE